MAGNPADEPSTPNRLKIKTFQSFKEKIFPIFLFLRNIHRYIAI